MQPTLTGVAVGAVVGVGAVAAAPFVLSAVGFTSAGIAAGSYAASMMSAAAVANGGAVTAGSTVAVLQSVGAAGLAATTQAAIVGGATAVGAAWACWFRAADPGREQGNEGKPNPNEDSPQPPEDPDSPAAEQQDNPGEPAAEATPSDAENSWSTPSNDSAQPNPQLDRSSLSSWCSSLIEQLKVKLREADLPKTHVREILRELDQLDEKLKHAGERNWKHLILALGVLCVLLLKVRKHLNGLPALLSLLNKFTGTVFTNVRLPTTTDELQDPNLWVNLLGVLINLMDRAGQPTNEQNDDTAEDQPAANTQENAWIIEIVRLSINVASIVP